MYNNTIHSLIVLSVLRQAPFLCVLIAIGDGPMAATLVRDRRLTFDTRHESSERSLPIFRPMNGVACVSARMVAEFGCVATYGRLSVCVEIALLSV